MTGLDYAQKGCSFKDVEDENGKVWKNKLKYDYLELPLKLKFKIANGFGISSGMLLGYLIKARHNKNDVKSVCHKIDFSIPISVSYEFKNRIVVETSYILGLSSVYEEGSIKNRSLNCTVGYKF